MAIREKIFPTLSEDAWILYAADRGGCADGVRLVSLDRFLPSSAIPRGGQHVSLAKLRQARGRLRRWLLPPAVRETYEQFERSADVLRLGSIASVGIGYVSGDNDFFHLRRSTVRRARIDTRFLRPAVRRGSSLPLTATLTPRQVQQWIENDDPVLLLHLSRDLHAIPKAIRRYLDSEAGLMAREAYKCRVRNPWYAVPDVTVPDGFLTYMSGETVQVIRNAAGCVGTNSVHVVRMRPGSSFRRVQEGFDSALTRLSCEIEGHPLGGGMLKVEPREAQRLLLPTPVAQATVAVAAGELDYGTTVMREWRGYA